MADPEPININARMIDHEPEQAPKRRENYVEWEDYYMSVAFLAAKRSKDPNLQVGACIVDPEKRIVGIGYNGMPYGCADTDYPWGKDPTDPFKNKHTFVCHAEMNAIVHKTVPSVKGCTMYVGLFPCNECAKIIIQAGIRKVVYRSDAKHKKPEYKASRKMLADADVFTKQYIPKYKIILDFGIETDEDPINPEVR